MRYNVVLCYARIVLCDYYDLHVMNCYVGSMKTLRYVL